jgi:hypothetical protein
LNKHPWFGTPQMQLLVHRHEVLKMPVLPIKSVANVIVLHPRHPLHPHETGVTLSFANSRHPKLKKRENPPKGPPVGGRGANQRA